MPSFPSLRFRITLGMAPNKCVFMLERNTASFTCGLTRTLICYHGDDEM